MLESLMNINGVEIYIAGGYVRDRLMGRDPKDHDFVVVGATQQDMLSLGFNQVGADFPVFLASTGDEFALARTERKTGEGYQGFTCVFDTSVTLAEDLKRRDLTINAMARKVIGWNDKGHAELSDTIIDPFHGQADLEFKTFRPVSDHFMEDPVRVLRLARFAARYSDFELSCSMKIMLQRMLVHKELDSLVPERTWTELAKAISEPTPHRFFQVLNDNDCALPIFGFDLSSIVTLLLKIQHHNCSMTRLLAISSVMGDMQETFFGKFKVPTKHQKCANSFRRACNRIQSSVSNAVTPETVMRFIEDLDAIRNPGIVEPVCNVLEVHTPQFKQIRSGIIASFDDVTAVNFESLDDNIAPGPAVGVAIRAKRVEAIHFS